MHNRKTENGKIGGAGMIKTKFVFAVSFVAMMAVGTGYAEIAGVSYVEQQVGVATTAANNAQTSANQANTAAGNAQTSANNAQDAADAAQDSADAAAASAKTANDTIAGLNLSAVGADGSYIKTISQANGKVSATKESADTAPTSGSTKMVTSGGVYTALDGKVNVSQGTENVGKGLVVDGSTGKLTLTDVATQAELNALTTANSSILSDVDTLKSDVSGLKTSVSELDSEKQDVISDLATIRSGATAGSTAVQTNQTTTNANKIMITNASGSVTPVAITASGSGTVVTAVSVEDGKLTVTKGTTLGSLATKSSVASADITDGAVTTAKIADGNVTTAKIAANAVTVAKTSGIYGYIPTASDGSGAAQIWVE